MRKLLKHEFRNNLVEICILDAILIGLCIVVGFLTRLNITHWLGGVVLSILITGLVGIAVSIISVIVLNTIRSFNNKLFTDEGYLTLSLPISMDKILISKYIANIIYIIISFLSGVIGIILLIFIALNDYSPDIIKMLAETAKEIFRNPVQSIVLIINMIVYLTLFITYLLFVLVILNSGKIKKAKLLIGLIFYSAVENIVSLIMVFISYFSLCLVHTETGFSIKMLGDGQAVGSFIPFVVGLIGEYEIVLNINAFIFQICCIIGLYFLSRFIISNKLELE